MTAFPALNELTPLQSFIQPSSGNECNIVPRQTCSALKKKKTSNLIGDSTIKGKRAADSFKENELKLNNPNQDCSNDVP
jgi:hypothetical protein